MKKIIFTLLLLSLLPSISNARENVSDWYIKDFKTEIIVEENSSLLITEMITADCGENKRHGIFRVLPLEMRIKDDKKVATPIDLISITDFDGKRHNYTSFVNTIYNTLTWKIGDENIYVTGENYYKIRYRVHNVIHDNVLHWDILGNFWELEIDNFTAEIIFPQDVSLSGKDISYFGGSLGAEDQEIASYHITEENSIVFSSTRKIDQREGLTAVIDLPENRFSSKHSFFVFLRIYKRHLSLLLPLLVFLISLLLWRKHGKEYRHKGAIREFSGPKGISPAIALLIYNNRKFTTKIIAVSIINLAVNGFLKIEKVEKKILLMKSEEIHFKRLKEEDPDCNLEKLILDEFFGKKKETSLKEIRLIIPGKLKKIKDETEKILIDGEFFYKKGVKMQTIKQVLAIIFAGAGVPALFSLDLFIGHILLLSSVILFFFSSIITKRTKKGVDAFLHMKGLREYMNTAEKERQIFYEEEDIFEKLLPYAIAFNMTKKWIKKVENIRGEDYFKGYTPRWYSGSINSFNVNSLTSTINGISQQISSSSSSGGGGSGGGGGGGGGGGW